MYTRTCGGAGWRLSHFLRLDQSIQTGFKRTLGRNVMEWNQSLFQELNGWSSGLQLFFLALISSQVSNQRFLLTQVLSESPSTTFPSPRSQYAMSSIISSVWLALIGSLLVLCASAQEFEMYVGLVDDMLSY